MKLGDSVAFTTTLKRTSVYSSGRWDKEWTPTSKGGSGILIGLRILADGVNEHCLDEPISFQATNYFKAALVATDLRRRPVLVPLDSVVVIV
jgi:hypothetical protein